MNSPPPRSYPKRGQRTTATSYSRRHRRSTNTPRQSIESSGSAAQKWTKVHRHPGSPPGEPYFGSGPSASFVVPMWVRVEDLNSSELEIYEEVERKREEERSAWKKIVEERRGVELGACADDEDDAGNELVIDSNVDMVGETGDFECAGLDDAATSADVTNENEAGEASAPMDDNFYDEPTGIAVLDHSIRETEHQ